MTDYRNQLVSDVTESLVGKLDSSDIGIVSDEMVIALRDYEVTKRVTDLVTYDGYDEMVQKRYRACMIIAGKSPKTIEQYDRIVRKLFLTLQKHYTDMTVSDLRYFLAMEKSRGVSDRTLENTRVMISSFFTWLLDEELISKNPCHSIKPIRYEDKVRLPFSSVEIDAIRSACRNTKERAIVEFLLSSGVRVSELCSIRIEDVDFEKLSVKVLKGKGSKQRMVYINEVARKHLLNYLNNRETNGDYLFYNKKREPLKAGGVRHILKELEKRAEITNCHPHRFRRTFATGLSSRGMEIQEIARLLGHANVNTTLEYVHMSDEKIQNSYRRFIS